MNWSKVLIRYRVLVLVVLALSLSLGSMAYGQEARVDRIPTILDDGKAFRGLQDPAVEFFRSREFQKLQEVSGAEFEKNLYDRVFRLEHDVPIGGGRTLRVYEFFTLGSWLSWPRRAVLLPSSFLGSSWDSTIEGYNGGEMLARQNMFAFAVDLIGTGESFRPANGNDVFFEDNVDGLEAVVRYIRFFRWVPKVDLLGEGVGAALATQLAADSHRIRSAFLVSNLYLEQQDGPATDPAFIEFLLSLPDGYVFVGPETFSVFYPGSPPEFQAFFDETQQGFYPVASFTVALELPFYDPGVARVPGLVVQGEFDLVATPEDAAALAVDYGTDGADLVILEGVGRAPRFETPEAAATFWDLVFDFFDP